MSHFSLGKVCFLYYCILISAISIVSGMPIVKEEFLSPSWENFDCHSSSIIETIPGNLCAIWKGGPGKGKSNIDIHENVGIWLSLYDGNSWSAPKEIVSIPRSVCWTPVLAKLASGDLLLFYRIGPDPRNVVSLVKRSTDGGISWSQEDLLPAGIAGPKSKPVVTSNGTLICPSSVQVGNPQDEYKATACWIEITEDQGQHWKKIGPLELSQRKFGPIEPVLFYDKNGHLRMLCRDRAQKIGEKGYLWTAKSSDNGLNWAELTQTDLPNPDSGLDIVDLGQGKIVLFYNHSHINRYPLHLALSLDGGDTWTKPIIIDESGEFPSATLSSDGLIHVTYAKESHHQGQRKIKHLAIDSETILSY